MGGETCVKRLSEEYTKRRFEEAERYLSYIDAVYTKLQVLELKVEFGVSTGNLTRRENT